jgi:hypothetical protein
MVGASGTKLAQTPAALIANPITAHSNSQSVFTSHIVRLKERVPVLKGLRRKFQGLMSGPILSFDLDAQDW